MSTDAEREVVDLCSELIRIDSRNYGDGTGPGERAAAEYVAERLAEVGVESELHESAPGRTSLVARVEGADRDRPALLVHGHLDVVPAQAADWQVDPFAGKFRRPFGESADATFALFRGERWIEQPVELPDRQIFQFNGVAADRRWCGGRLRGRRGSTAATRHW